MLPSLSVHRENTIAQSKAFPVSINASTGKPTGITNSQGLEGASSKRAEFKVVKLCGKHGLDIFRIGSDEEPIPEDVKLISSYRSALKL